MKLTDAQVTRVCEVMGMFPGYELACETGMVRNGRRETCGILSDAVRALAEEVLASRAAAPKKGKLAK